MHEQYDELKEACSNQLLESQVPQELGGPMLQLPTTQPLLFKSQSGIN